MTKLYEKSRKVEVDITDLTTLELAEEILNGCRREQWTGTEEIAKLATQLIIKLKETA